MKETLEILNLLNIKYEIQDHGPIFTSLEAEKIKWEIDGIGCKNLFLKDNNGNYYIYLLLHSKRADLKYLSEFLKVEKIKFASPEELKTILNLTPGVVNPLSIINDKNHEVTILFDKDIVNIKILCHPNDNSKSISIEYKDLIKYITHFKNKYMILEVSITN